jgi:hypothetical protein
MKKFAAVFVIILVFTLFAPLAAPISVSGDEYEVEFKGKVGEELDKIDVDQLLDKISTLLEKYKFNDDDVLELTDATQTFIKTVNGYSKKLKAQGPDTPESETAAVVAPHEELKSYCVELEKFLKKYNVTVEDTLRVGRAVAFVAMSIKEDKAESAAAQGSDTGDDVKKSIASKDDVDAVFVQLMEFSKKHNMMACDFMPVIYRICDIGLTLLQNRVSLAQLKQAGGRWRKRLYDLGVSKEQADGLYDSLVAFIYKYKISLKEIMVLNKEINRLLKSSKDKQKH